MADIHYKRRFGDRNDGRLLRSLAPYFKFIPFVMKDRNDASNYFSDKIEVSDIDRWLRRQRAEGYKGLGFLHLILAAYVRTVASRPGINRFVSGQRVYARYDITVNMVVKRGMDPNAPDTAIKVIFDPTDTVYDVYRKLTEKVEEIKASDDTNNTEDVAAALCRLPRFLLRIAVKLLYFMDYFGLIPPNLLAASPFHGSLIITDLGSLGIPPIYHHLYNFGNLPLFLSFGAKRRAVELDDAGRPVERKYVDYTVVTDERICDGFYYASAFKYIKHYMRNPQLLETPPEHVEEDIF